MNMTNIINTMITLFLMMGVGYTCGKLNIIDPPFSKKLSNLILTVTTPAMILSSVASGDSSFPKSTAVQVMIISVVTFVIMIPLAFIVAKLLRAPSDESKLYTFMFIFGNAGFMGYPVISTIFGSDAIFLDSLYIMMQSVVLYSLGLWLMSNDGSKFSVKKLINPCMIASILALIIFLTGFRIPSILASVFNSIGSITSPAAMLLIGAGLSIIPIKDIFTEFRLYPFAAIKQIATPLIIYFVLGLFVKDPTLLGIMTIVCAMPVANISVMFATQYDGNINLASKGVFITTMCSFVTIPLLCMFLG